MIRPGDYFFTSTHEWLKIEGNTITVGITDFAQAELSDIIFVELPKIGRKIEKGDDIAVVESVKTASDILAPVDGEIIEVNNVLSDKPELINEDPFGEGWILKVKASSDVSKEDYLDSDAYEKAIIGGGSS